MRLGTKILLTISATFAGLIVVLLFISQSIFLGSFQRYEKRDIALNVERVLSALEGEIANLSSLNLDWASWDDSYAFVKNRNRAFIKSNLNNETLAKQRLNIIVLLDEEGRTVIARSLNHYSMKDAPYPGGLKPLTSPGGLLLDNRNPQSRRDGIIMLNAGPMMVSSRPILTSEGKGPVRGTLIMGRFIDESEIGKLAEKTHMPVRFSNYGEAAMKEISNGASRPLAGLENILVRDISGGLAAGYGIVKDMKGDAAFIIEVKLPRDIYGQGKTSLYYFIIYLLAAALASAAAILILLKRNVLSRVSHIGGIVTEIEQSGNLSERVRVSGNDELSALSGNINRMLESLEDLETERRASGEKIRKANDELEARVRERTAELVEKNVTLNGEIAERKRVEEEMQEMIYHDYLTGLPNRMLFVDRLNQIIARRRKAGETIAAILLLDMDRFKDVNESLGHSAGDEIIKKAAALLQGAFREGDTVARVGGDEFTILLQDIAKIDDIPQVVERIFALFAKPFEQTGQSVFLTASIGIAVYPFDGEDSGALLKHADIAMYHAKSRGGNSYEMYDPEMAKKALERLTIGNRLRTALEKDEFVLHYQPLYDLRKGRFTGSEALIRWNDRELGLVPPMKFIPIAEENGAIIPIGEWGLRKACKLTKSMLEKGAVRLSVSVNISPRMFAEPGFPGKVVNILDEVGFDPGHLKLEITEGILMANLDLAAKTIKTLTDVGIRFSIDDFGTGYSSLAYLKNLSIHELKIDRSFIMDLTTDADDRSIIKAIISLAHGMNLEVTAEGVETQDQLDFLAEHRCDTIQGFLLARPMPEDEFTRLIMKDNSGSGAI